MNNMDIEQEKRFVENLRKVLLDDAEAITYCLQLTYVSHIWDDLIDKDKPIKDEEIHNAFRICLYDIQKNPFYRKYQDELLPITLNCILQWQDATRMERGDDHDKHMAYMLRVSLISLFAHCALLVGGTEWAYKIGPEVRRIYSEDFGDYMKEMELWSNL